ncbi:hypothetical protein A9K55_007185 [Cordyceps militaris]|uniref:Uncharacterized protein n=1 Tax=Cordyceps militaris TaxID=73501 RepID=A0A2H4SHV8_CORMI|nr:hypothetical protein A9K55_007185 [Cordyceps militaris]
MTYDQNTFAAFYWLPEEDPANIITISSDDDDGGVSDAERRYPDLEQEPPRDTEPSPEDQAASAAFRKAISASMPIYLTGWPERHHLRAAAVRRLECALCAGAALDAVFIDDHGLPAWPGCVWDPEAQSLHDVVQERLRECQDAWALGARLRAVLVQLGNERLAEARRMGVQLEDLKIGEDLLPTWRGRDADEDNAASDGDGDTMMEVGSSVHSEDLPLLWSDSPARETKEEEEEAQAVVDGGQPASAWSSDSETEDSAPPSVSDDDDDTSLFNFVSQLPVNLNYDDAEAPHTNVIHNVDVFGASFPVDGPVDFEVYLVEDDPEVAALPEVELAVDEEAFAHHYGLDDVVAIELGEDGLYFVTLQNDGEPESEEGMQNSAEEDSPNEPVLPPPSDGEAQMEAGWVVI